MPYSGIPVYFVLCIAYGIYINPGLLNYQTMLSFWKSLCDGCLPNVMIVVMFNQICMLVRDSQYIVEDATDAQVCIVTELFIW